MKESDAVFAVIFHCAPLPRSLDFDLLASQLASQYHLVVLLLEAVAPAMLDGMGQFDLGGLVFRQLI